MKKLPVILLLLLLLAASVGQRCFLHWASHRADQTLVAKLDKGQYSLHQLVTVKVPVQLPYQNNWAKPERVDGELEYKGKTFRYVSRQLVNDTMVLQCIPHTQKDALKAAANPLSEESVAAGNHHHDDKAKGKAPAGDTASADYDDHLSIYNSHHCFLSALLLWNLMPLLVYQAPALAGPFVPPGA